MDRRETLRPGAKFFDWERRGVPLRLEVGKRDVANKGVMCARRVDGQKMALPVDGLEARLEDMLEEVQEGMLERAQRFVQQHWHRVEQYAEMRERLRGRKAEEAEDGEVEGNMGGFFLAPWRDSVENEARIKEECKATIRCYPDGWQQEAGASGGKSAPRMNHWSSAELRPPSAHTLLRATQRTWLPSGSLTRLDREESSERPAKESGLMEDAAGSEARGAAR
eukprot:ctg_784.g269